MTVGITGTDGMLAPHANNEVRFAHWGPGDILTTGIGNPVSFGSLQSPLRKAFNGQAVLVVRRRAGQPGTRVPRTVSDGLAPHTIILTRYQP